MSQAGLPNFKWPTAAPGALDVPKFSLDQGSAISTAMTTGPCIMTTSPATRPVSTDVVFSAKTVHITVASILNYGSTANTSAASLIHQTKPLDLHGPVTPITVSALAPEITAVAFELYTSSADPSVSVLAETMPNKWNSGSAPNPSPSNTNKTFASDNFGAKIAGIIVGSVLFVFFISLTLVFWRACRSRHIKDSKSAPVNMEAALELKRQRAHHLGLDRWSRRDTEQSLERFKKLKADAAAKNAAKKDGAIVEEAEGTVFVVGEDVQEPQMQYERNLRRPSGLMMHPPTPVEAGFKEDEGNCVGRAL